MKKRSGINLNVLIKKEEKIINIHRIVSRDTERLAGNRMHIYNCISEINGVEIVLQIKYEVDTRLNIL